MLQDDSPKSGLRRLVFVDWLRDNVNDIVRLCPEVWHLTQPTRSRTCCFFELRAVCGVDVTASMIPDSSDAVLDVFKGPEGSAAAIHMISKSDDITPLILLA
jgi:hypothetical protein